MRAVGLERETRPLLKRMGIGMENGKRVEERGDAVRRDRIGEKVIAGDGM